MIRSVIACEIEKEKKKNTPPIYFRQTPSLLSLSLSLSTLTRSRQHKKDPKTTEVESKE